MKDKLKQKQDQRKKRWSKRICLRNSQHKFISNEMSRLNFNTLAGTLDFIINFYKIENEKK